MPRWYKKRTCFSGRELTHDLTAVIAIIVDLSRVLSACRVQNDLTIQDLANNVLQELTQDWEETDQSIALYSGGIPFRGLKENHYMHALPDGQELWRPDIVGK